MATATTGYPRWPEGASDEYIKAREDLLKDEWALRDQIEKLAAKRRALPTGATMKAYEFEEGPKDLTDDKGEIKTTSLADLVSDGRSLVVYHLMFAPEDEAPCGMCAMVVDGFNGDIKHFEQNFNFAIIGKAPINKLRAYAVRRGWNQIRLLSSFDTTFNKDMIMEQIPAMGEYNGQMPGVSVFKKDGEGNVKHVYTQSAYFGDGVIRGLDMYTPLWNLLDLVPEGRGDFNASNEYMLEG